MGWFADLQKLRETRDEYKALFEYQKTRTDAWRGIAAAMGYEGKAHLDVRPTSKWIVERVAEFRRAVAVEEFATMVAEQIASINSQQTEGNGE